MKIELQHDALNEGHLRYEHLLGKEFKHGTQDCYTILQSMFLDNLNIQLSDFARPDDWWVYNKELDFYMSNYQSEGFKLIDQDNLRNIRPMDVFLISIPDSRDMSSSVANHCAVYLGHGHIIHHRLGKLSQVAPYRYAMKDWTTAVIRHKDCPDLTKCKEISDDIMNYLLPHKRELVMGVLNERKNRGS